MNKTQIRVPGWRGNGKEGALRRLGLDHAVSIPALYNLASITRHVRGGKTAFMELAESAAALQLGPADEIRIRPTLGARPRSPGGSRA